MFSGSYHFWHICRAWWHPPGGWHSLNWMRFSGRLCSRMQIVSHKIIRKTLLLWCLLCLYTLDSFGLTSGDSILENVHRCRRVARRQMVAFLMTKSILVQFHYFFILGYNVVFSLIQVHGRYIYAGFVFYAWSCLLLYILYILITLPLSLYAHKQGNAKQ